MKSAPLFLTFEEVIEIHADQISRYGGSAGLRDEGLLRSALSQPEAEFGGQLLHPAVASQAAAYLFHLVKNHAFVDGNKRVGAACGLVFLEINGWELDPKLDDIDPSTGRTHFENIVLAVASSEMSKEELTEFIADHIQDNGDV